MTHTIRIKKRGPRDLYFDVDGDVGNRLASSAPFDTICQLESGLALLSQAAQMPERTVVEHEAELTSVGCSPGRKRVRFVGSVRDAGVRDLLAGIVTAKVIDERPKDQRRADLSGRLCDIGH